MPSPTGATGETGGIRTVADGADYAGKPRPAVIARHDGFDGTTSATICIFTTNEREAPLFRLPISSNSRSGLVPLSRITANGITAAPKRKIGEPAIP